MKYLIILVLIVTACGKLPENVTITPTIPSGQPAPSVTPIVIPSPSPTPEVVKKEDETVKKSEETEAEILVKKFTYAQSEELCQALESWDREKEIIVFEAQNSPTTWLYTLKKESVIYSRKDGSDSKIITSGIIFRNTSVMTNGAYTLVCKIKILNGVVDEIWSIYGT